MNYFWVAKNGSWSGPTGLGTEESPFYGAIGLYTAFDNGTIPASGGHTIMFMGEYGAVLQPEIQSDFPQQNKAITQALTAPPWTGDSCRWKTGQGGIFFGDRPDEQSKCRNNTFLWRGDVPWHIDARGATVNAGRISAALAIQGTGNVVDGLRLAQPDWNWIAGGRVPATGITYAAEGSFENYGLQIRGGWGCHTRNCVVWGGDAFGRAGITFLYASYAANENPNSPSSVLYNVVSGGYEGIDMRHMAGAVDAGSSYPTLLSPAAGSDIEVAHNTVSGCRWGDTAATPAINNAMNHGGPIKVNSLAAIFARIRVHHNDLSGWCQDGVELISVGVECEYNDVHDMNPGSFPGNNCTYWIASGASWVTTTAPVVCSMIKAGLSGYDGSLDTGDYSDTFVSVGTSSGTFLVPALWNKVMFNRVWEGGPGIDVNGIRTNGATGAIVHGNEVWGVSVALSVSSTGSADRFGQVFVSHNYLSADRGYLRSISFGARQTVFLYNNILDCPDGYAYTWSGNPGMAYGANNVINGLQGYPANMTLTGTVAATPAYVIGTGPTPAGNCWAGGSAVARQRSWFSGAQRLLDASSWPTGRVPIGPRAGSSV